MKQRRLQGGSLAGYIIVAVLLGLVLVGGLYGLQRYNAGDIQIAGSQDEKGQEQPKSKDDAPKDDSSDKKTDKKPPATSDSNEDKTTSADELPATGPESGLLAGLALASLTYAGTSLVRSRAHRWTSRGN